VLLFSKMNGAGNDFVVIDNRSLTLSLSTRQLATLCDRHRGVGADGVLLVEPPQGSADFRMRYYNADGGEAEMCGNGARCFTRFANRLAGPFEKIRFETMAGLIEAEINGEWVRLNMGAPQSLSLNGNLEIGGRKLAIHLVNTGVPHAVTFVDDLDNTPVFEWGRAIRRHPSFQPKGTNVNFVKVLGPSQIRIRTYERGVEDETLACGTGVVAAALIYASLFDGSAPSSSEPIERVQIQVRGGDWLEVGFERTGPNFRNVTLKGPADFAFEGQIDLV
jgi:diaminopimelate epimerase